MTLFVELLRERQRAREVTENVAQRKKENSFRVAVFFCSATASGGVCVSVAMNASVGPGMLTSHL